MKKIFFILTFLSGFSNLQNLNALELKKVQWETVESVKIPVKDKISGQAVFRFNGEKFLWGTGVSGKILKEKLPFDVKAGNLNFSGAVSLLNNPLLSSVISPFSVPQSTVSFMASRVGESSSWNKPLSGYLKISNGAVFFTEEKQLGLSWFYKNTETRKKEKKKLEAQCTFLSSPQSAKQNDSWYWDRPLSKDEYRTSALLFQGVWENKDVSFLFSDMIFVSGESRMFQVFRSENRLGPFSLSMLINPNHNILTPSGKTIDEFYQFKCNIQGNRTTLNTIPFFWKYGFSVLGNINPVEKELVLKSSGGFRIFCFLTSLNVNLSEENTFYFENGKTDNVMNKISLSLRNGWYFSFFQPVFRGSFSFIPKEDFSSFQLVENLGVSFSFSTMPLFFMSINSELKQKNGTWQGGNGGLGFTMKYRQKFFDVSIKVDLSIEF